MKQNETAINAELMYADSFVRNTEEHLYLTGKAGTGKTTFLKKLKEDLPKNMVVLAPTGVAAINAGGMTIHSFFQIPPGNYLPDNRGTGFYNNLIDRVKLTEYLRFQKNKREIIRELELVVIDEVSMVRADLLDAVDYILRFARRKPNEPFGGVQMLFIGDLFQLPPVVKEDEWLPLQSYYETPYFFSAQVMKEISLIHLELKTIYRQSDQKFIDLLNRVRNNECVQEDFDLLNSKNLLESQDRDTEDFITLSTHNWKVDKINSEKLRRISEEEVTYEALIERDFPDRNFPVDPILKLKTGAQVMFMRNDSSGERKYYNGRLAVVTALWDSGIKVRFLDNHSEYEVEQETWENIKYGLKDETGKIEEEVVGTFTQFPLRLAWAVTIHKSQGLTFDNVLIDAGAAFAFGQVYVALSRCRSLEGIKMMTAISKESVLTDSRVLRFSEDMEMDIADLKDRLRISGLAYAKKRLMESFNFSKLSMRIHLQISETQSKQFDGKEEVIKYLQLMLQSLEKQEETAKRFRLQLQDLLKPVQTEAGSDELNERVQKAIVYFGNFIRKEILEILEFQYAELLIKKRTKGYIKTLNVLIEFVRNFVKRLQQLSFFNTGFYNGPNLIPERVEEIKVSELQSVYSNKPSKKEKGINPQKKLDTESTFDISYRMYKDGNSIEEIAQMRGFVPSTIESHLRKFVMAGKLDVYQFITKEKLDTINAATQKFGTDRISDLKNKLGDSISWGELKMALAWMGKENVK